MMPLTALALSILPGLRLFPEPRAVRNYGTSASKYTPHQGDREKARRVRQMENAS